MLPPVASSRHSQPETLDHGDAQLIVENNSVAYEYTVSDEHAVAQQNAVTD